MSAANVIEILWSEHKRPLSDEALEKLAGASCGVRENLGSISEIMDGIACLVCEDAAHGQAGSFQTADTVFELLTGFSASIRNAASAMFVISEANAILRERMKTKIGAQQ